SFAIIVVWSARSGRTVGFAFGVNWILAAWALSLGRVLQSRSGAWDGLSVRLPAWYYATRPFEKGGRIYDYLGVRWYQRLLRPVLWSVEPARLRSRGVRQTMIRETQNPEPGHLRRDPRLSIEERYTSLENYLQRVRAAAMSLIENRYMLREDLDSVMLRARTHWQFSTGGRLPAAAVRQ